MAVAAARALGLDTSQNPYFTGATFGVDQSQIVISVALPNGGTLTSPAPGAIRNFTVGGVSTGFTGAIVGNAVVLTKDSGTWNAGVQVRHVNGGENRADGDVAAEAAIIDGMLYETWAPDAVGVGLPVSGRMDGGIWVPTFAVTL